MNAENSKRAENNWDDDDNDITNEKDLCLSFIKSFKNSRNLSFEIEKNTSLSLKKIDQALFDVKFFDIDDFLRLLRVCAVSLASEKSQLCKDVTQSSMKQSSLSRMSNSMFSINDESMIATITLKVWNSLKRKTNTVNMNEDSRVKIHEDYIHFNFDVFNNLTEQSLEVLNNIKINKSFIKSIFESSNERNKNSDIMSTKTLFKSLSKQILTFSKLSELNFKRETQTKHSDQCACLHCCKHVW